MSLFNIRDNQNGIFYLLLLILLAVFAGPNILPSLVSDLVPFVDEGVPCSRLRAGTDRAYHQSIIGRSVSQQQGEDSSPFTLSVRTSAAVSGLEDTFTVTVTVFNRTLGTVPILITPGQLAGATTDIPGLGIAFGGQGVGNLQSSPGSYPSDQIRLLGPRQRCVHRVQFTGNAIPSPATIAGTPVQAFYRNNVRGIASPRPGSDRPISYTDQGLWIGTVTSPTTIIPSSNTQQP